MHFRLLPILAVVTASLSSCDTSAPPAAGLPEAKQLIANGQPEAAVPILRAIVSVSGSDTSQSAEPSYLLAESLLACGEAEEAWPHFEALLRKPPPGSRFPELRIKAAQALNRLGRQVDARTVILPHLLLRPADRTALHTLSVTLRGIDNPAARETASALTRRSRELLLPEWAKERALRTSYVAWATLELARSYASRDRLGDALLNIDKLLEGLTRDQTDPRTLRLLLVQKAEALIQLAAVPDAIRQIDTAIGKWRVLALDLARARLFLRSGARDGAERILAATAKSTVTGPARDLLRAHRARVLAEFGTGLDEVLDFVKKPFENTPSDQEDPEIAEIANFCRAELHIANGRGAEALRAVGQSVFSLAGGREWSGAIRLVADPTAHPAPTDPSDLIDHSHIAIRALRHSIFANNSAFKAVAERARLALRDRAGILLEIVNAPNETTRTTNWLRLLRLYRSHDALRKAREVGWYLWVQRPNDLQVSLELVASLQRPEELLERLYVIEMALRMHKDDAQLRQMRTANLERLGIAP